MKTLKIHFLTLFILLTNIAFAVSGNFTAEVDRNNIALGDTFTLTLTLEGERSHTSPDLSILDKDFTVIATQQSVHMSSINGKSKLQTQWEVILTPKKEGKLKVPSVKLEQLNTKPIVINVVAVNTPTTASDAKAIFMKASLDNKTPYVQSQAIYTVKIFYATNLIRASLSDPYVKDAVVMALGKDINYQTTLKDKRYNVIERRYAIFPQKSGTLEIKPPVLNGAVVSPQQTRSRMQQFFSTGGKPIQLTVPAEKINVLPKPAGFTSEHWLPANSLELSEHWSEQPIRFEEGQAITRQITVTAKGLTGAQLPDIKVGDVKNMNTYPDQAVVDSQIHDGNIIGIRSEKVAYVPTQAGQVRLPEVAVSWWDTKTNQKMIAKLPARMVTVLSTTKTENAAPVLQIAPAEQTITNTSLSNTDTVVTEKNIINYWSWLAGIFFVLWLVTLIFFLKRKKTITSTKVSSSQEKQNDVSLTKLRNAIKQACAANDANAIAGALKDWARVIWLDVTINNLSDISQRIDSEKLANMMMMLDAVLYKGDNAEWDSQTFWQAFSDYKPSKAKAKKDGNNDLPELYLS